MNTKITVLAVGAMFAAGLGIANPAAAAAPSCLGHRATIVGTNHADRLVGTRRDDVIVGLGGNDVIVGRGGDDLVCGGLGKDRIDAGSGTDRVSGDAGNDTIVTGPGPNDDAIGGAGNDYIRVTGAYGNALGDAGNDVVVVTRPGADVFAGAGADTVAGSRFADRIFGGPDDDHIRSGAGNDRVWAAGGSDLVDGGPGADQLDSGAGDDQVSGGTGNDAIDGGPGTDVCNGGAGRDTCDGGAPGTPTNSASDPDLCTAERELSCHADEKPFTATASGTLIYNGLTETWTATGTMSSFAGTTFQGPASFIWNISGTTGDGCSYTGNTSFDGVASLSIFGDEYAHEWRPSRAQQVDVTETCPLTGTRTVQLWPLNTDAASTALVKGEPGPGHRTYHPNGDGSITSDWSWHITG